jgi:two-component system, LytTR family, sensor kinase
MSLFQESIRARKASRVRTGFFIHLAAYALVNALLVCINVATTPDRLWFQWPLLGWGVGILAHGIAAFAFAGHRTR